MPARKDTLNLDPIGPAHVYWPNGAPTRRAPRAGIYSMFRRLEQFYRREEPFPKNTLEFKFQ